jgi:hypothetical protein
MNSRLWIRPCADLVRRGQGRNQPPAHGLKAIAGSGLTERPRRVEIGHSFQHLRRRSLPAKPRRAVAHGRRFQLKGPGVRKSLREGRTF